MTGRIGAPWRVEIEQQIFLLHHFLEIHDHLPEERDLVVRFVSKFFSELVMMFLIRKKRVPTRIYGGMMSNRWLKQHRSTQKWDTGQLG